MILEYIGDGRHIAGIPARDLQESDTQAIEAYGSLFDLTKTQTIKALVNSGLYQKPSASVAPTLPETVAEDNE